MKNYLLIISLFAALSVSIFTGCQSNGARAHNSTDVLCNPQMIFPEDHGQKQKHTLVFIDLTDASIYGENAKSYLQKVYVCETIGDVLMQQQGQQHMILSKK